MADKYFIRVGDVRYPAISFSATQRDYSWDDRASKTFSLTMDISVAKTIFTVDVPWYTVVEADVERPVLDAEENFTRDEFGNVITETITVSNEDDCSEWCVPGDIVDHRDGTITIKMGKKTELENALAMLLGGSN